MDQKLKTNADQPNPNIDRKEAIKRVGKYAAFTAASMMLLMSPAHADQPQKSAKKPKPHGG